MITAFIIAAFATASNLAQQVPQATLAGLPYADERVSAAPVYELAPITITVDVPETPVRTFEVCLHVPGEDSERACNLFECETMVEALHAGRDYYGAAQGIVTAEVSK